MKIQVHLQKGGERGRRERKVKNDASRLAERKRESLLRAGVEGAVVESAMTLIVCSPMRIRSSCL